MKKILLFIVISILFYSCHQQEKPIIAFYYWKTIFKLSSSEKEILKLNNVKKLYIRYLDVDLSLQTNQPIPLAPIHFKDQPIGFTIVPVVYIKNNVMLSKSLKINDLVNKLTKYIKQINTKNNIKIKEIQIDCDWTLTSKDNYLEFINKFKKANSSKLSATIRLHQIKYFNKTKIPNVDKGVLMYYNMGTIATDSLNSIYNAKIASKYLSSLKNYPLKLNVALPIYSWAIHSRSNRVLGLKNKINVSNLKKDTNFISIKNNLYKVKNSNFKQSTYYKVGDILKIELISKENLLEMATNLKQNLKQNPKEIIFYDLDQFNFQQYEKNIFTEISSSF